MSKPKLAILSDIFGRSEEHWMQEYIGLLSPFFNVRLFDSRELAGINSLPQEEVHSGFVKGGIQQAVQTLKKGGNQFEVIIGFSVGGTIAWKYALENVQASLFLISATRLRNEIMKPSTPIELYFGELEQNGPDSEWFQGLQIDPVIIKDSGHECYKEQKVIEHVCQQITMNFSELSR